LSATVRPSAVSLRPPYTTPMPPSYRFIDDNAETTAVRKPTPPNLFGVISRGTAQRFAPARPPVRES